MKNTFKYFKYFLAIIGVIWAMYYAFKLERHFSYWRLNKQERELKLCDSINDIMYGHRDYVFVPSEIVGKKMIERFGIKKFCIYVRVADSLDKAEYEQGRLKFKKDSIHGAKLDSIWVRYENSDCNPNKKEYLQQKKIDSAHRAMSKNRAIRKSDFERDMIMSVFGVVNKKRQQADSMVWVTKLRMFEAKQKLDSIQLENKMNVFKQTAQAEAELQKKN